jgi:hypothetical protein
LTFYPCIKFWNIFNIIFMSFKVFFILLKYYIYTMNGNQMEIES